VETVEHLLAALAGLQVDNCVIEINAREVPAVDGSSLPFCEAILAAGLARQHEPRGIIRVHDAQGVHDPQGEQWIEVVPSSDGTSSADYRLDYGPGSPLPPQSCALTITPEQFLKHIAGARTFVLSAEIEALRERGLGRHLKAGDLVVFEDDGTVSGNTLRWPDEPVRHKVLDCLGDLALAGKCFSGHIVARRSGHKLNHVMAKTLATIETGSLQRAA
jgi:UDP-3-O-acyl-N-acetylglucosamine deacetylase